MNDPRIRVITPKTLVGNWYEECNFCRHSDPPLLEISGPHSPSLTINLCYQCASKVSDNLTTLVLQSKDNDKDVNPANLQFAMSRGYLVEDIHGERYNPIAWAHGCDYRNLKKYDSTGWLSGPDFLEDLLPNPLLETYFIAVRISDGDVIYVIQGIDHENKTIITK